MHRLIMNSETYQMASNDIAANVAIDRENKYLWRMPRRRFEGEAIRDSIMAVAGNLDRTVGGPAVLPYIDPALFQSSSKRTWNGKPDSDPSTWRRSVYVFSKRSIPLPMLDVFDKPGQRRLLRAPQSQHDRSPGADPDEQRIRSDGGEDVRRPASQGSRHRSGRAGGPRVSARAQPQAHRERARAIGRFPAKPVEHALPTSARQSST